MVRLRWIYLGQQRVEWLSFQFHNGAIKIPIPYDRQSRQVEFQFHNGAIKIVRETERFRFAREISIPQWCD